MVQSNTWILFHGKGVKSTIYKCMADFLFYLQRIVKTIHHLFFPCHNSQYFALVHYCSITTCEINGSEYTSKEQNEELSPWKQMKYDNVRGSLDFVRPNWLNLHPTRQDRQNRRAVWFAATFEHPKRSTQRMTFALAERKTGRLPESMKDNKNKAEEVCFILFEQQYNL